MCFSEAIRGYRDGKDALLSHGVCQRRYVKFYSFYNEPKFMSKLFEFEILFTCVETKPLLTEQLSAYKTTGE